LRQLEDLDGEVATTWAAILTLPGKMPIQEMNGCQEMNGMKFPASPLCNPTPNSWRPLMLKSS
jgi:hypothetical protein